MNLCEQLRLQVNQKTLEHQRAMEIDTMANKQIKFLNAKLETCKNKKRQLKGQLRELASLRPLPQVTAPP